MLSVRVISVSMLERIARQCLSWNRFHIPTYDLRDNVNILGDMISR